MGWLSECNSAEQPGIDELVRGRIFHHIPIARRIKITILPVNVLRYDIMDCNPILFE